MVSILYLNGQKYLESARDYRTNYTQSHRLEMELKDSSSDLKTIRNKYCELLNTSSNHTEYDYLKALSNASDDYKEKRGWEKKSLFYVLRWLWRLGLKIIFLLLPIKGIAKRR